MLLFLNGYHGNNKNITVVFQMCQTIHPQNYMFVLAVQTEIFDTGYCWIVHLSFLTSHNLLFFRFCKTSKKTTFSVFLSFFLVKSPKSQSLKLNISRTAWPILMILVSFCRILSGLSDEINLFWRCSSPLMWKENKLLPQILFSLPNNIGLLNNFGCQNLKNVTRKQKVGYAKKDAIWMGNQFYYESCSLRNSWF